AIARPRRLAGGGHFCPAPDRGGVGGLDHRTQERPLRGFLFCGGAGVFPFPCSLGSQRASRAAKADLLSRPPFFRRRAAVQNRRVLPARRAVARSMVETRPPALEERPRAGAFLRLRCRLGLGHGLDRETPRRRQWNGMVADLCAALPHRRSRHVVLRRKTFVARPADFYLSALER